jgi:hypothetical protein
MHLLEPGEREIHMARTNKWAIRCKGSHRAHQRPQAHLKFMYP